MKKNLLFDLDGTLTDPKEGITRCTQYALEKLGKPVPDREELTWCIGPPFLECLRELLGPDAGLAERALELYRERFGDVGKFENEVYEDIPEVLEMLRGRGYRLFTATAKPLVYATDILAHFELARFFDAVHGAEMSGERTDKAELIAHVLETERLDADETAMIGDREHDVIGARQCRVESVAVTYGYGTADELNAARPDHTISTPRELLRLFAAVPKTGGST